MQGILGSFFKSSYSRKLENVNQKDDYLDRYNLPKLNQDQVIYLNSSIPIKKFKQSLKVSQPKAAQLQMNLLPSILPAFQRKAKSNMPQRTQQNRNGRNNVKLILHGHSHPGIYTKDSRKIGNCRVISFINIDAKLLNKILAN